jgi:sugar lactone lactonase YvrE
LYWPHHYTCEHCGAGSDNCITKKEIFRNSILFTLLKSPVMKLRLLLPLLALFFCVSCKKDDLVKVKQDSYVLPGDRFFPEGIALNSRAGVFYTGSTISGDVVQVNLETGAADLFSSGSKNGRSFVTGMKLDSRGRLWICGGPTGIIQVLDKNGNVIKNWDAKTLFGAGFINDCVISDGYIYFTDSQVQKIYRARVSDDDPGDLEEWLVFTNQQIPYAAGTNANGIEVTPDGRYLIVVISTSGKLYRIMRSDKTISEITLNTPVPSGDGLYLDGNTLFVSRNATNLVFPVALNGAVSQGTVGAGFGQNLNFNTTLVKAGKYLLVVNGQLNRRGGTPPPVLPFTVSRVEIP